MPTPLVLRHRRRHRPRRLRRRRRWRDAHVSAATGWRSTQALLIGQQTEALLDARSSASSQPAPGRRAGGLDRRGAQQRAHRSRASRRARQLHVRRARRHPPGIRHRYRRRARGGHNDGAAAALRRCATTGPRAPRSANGLPRDRWSRRARGGRSSGSRRAGAVASAPVAVAPRRAVRGHARTGGADREGLRGSRRVPRRIRGHAVRAVRHRPRARASALAQRRADEPGACCRRSPSSATRCSSACAPPTAPRFCPRLGPRGRARARRPAFRVCIPRNRAARRSRGRSGSISIPSRAASAPRCCAWCGRSPPGSACW